MEKKRIKMDFMTMDYFQGLHFNFFGNYPSQTEGQIAKEFDGYYGIQYNHSGKVQFALNHAQPVVYEGSVAFVTMPGHFFEYGPPPGGIRHHCYVCFFGPRTERFREHGLIPEQPAIIPIMKAERFYSTMQELQNILKQPGGNERPRAVLLLEDLLLQLQEQPRSTIRINAFCEQHLKRLRKEIAEQPQKNWDFEEEAGKISISYSHFRRIFRELTGCAPNRFLIECRLNRAMHLLVETVLPLREIAHQCGFQDEFYFSRLFKQYKHYTPSGYRKELIHFSS